MFGIPWKWPLVSTLGARGLSCAVSAFGWVLKSDLLRLSAEDVTACSRRSRSSSSHASKNPVVPSVFGFWNVSWTCRSNFLELFPKNARGHSILTKTITLLRKLPCWIMRDVISTNMSRLLWTARQSVYFSKSVKCKSLIGRVRREKKSFNVSPQSLIPSLVPKPVRAIRVTRGSFPDFSRQA